MAEPTPDEVTPNTAPSSPSTKVFAVTELLEAILLELPEADLLLSQRVCKKFQATIAGSKPLQRKLFFELEDNLDGSKEPVNFNPLLEKMFPQALIREIRSTVVRHLVKSCRQCDWQAPDWKRGEMCLSFPLFDHFLDKEQHYEQASWRKMWPTSFAVPLHAALTWTDDYGLEPMPAAKMGRVMEVLQDPANMKKANDEYNMDVFPWLDDEMV